MKKRAFTLSEVLIALTIIGVISAITLPRVMNNTNSSANILKLKRAYNVAQEALRISSARADYNMADITNLAHDASHPYNAQDLLSTAFDAKVNNNTEHGAKGAPVEYSSDVAQLSDYSETAKVSAAGDLFFSGRNGVVYVIKAKDTMTAGCTADKPCIFYIDINGAKGPNEIIMCTSGTNAIGTLAANEDGTYTEPDACTVDDSAITDIYPFFIYDGDIKPATSAVVGVLEK